MTWYRGGADDMVLEYLRVHGPSTTHAMSSSIDVPRGTMGRLRRRGLVRSDSVEFVPNPDGRTGSMRKVWRLV